jgi:hypothetical protein
MLAPNLLVARRNFEYWGMTVTERTQPCCLGDNLPDQYNLTGIAKTSTDAQAITGQLWNPIFTQETMTNVSAEVAAQSKNEKYFNGIDTYVVNEVTAEQAETVLHVFRNLPQKEGLRDGWWQRLFKLYPALKTPLDATARAQMEKQYESWLVNCCDEKAVADLARPYLVEMMETKYIAQPYWMRIAEALMDELESSANTTRFTKRSMRLVTERIAKISLNTLADHPWSHHETTSPYFMDVGCGHRVITEAGYW